MNSLIKPIRSPNLLGWILFSNRCGGNPGTKVNSWRHTWTMRNTGVAPTNPILSSLSFSLFDGPLVSPSQFEFHSLFAFELWAHWLSFTGRSPWARRWFCSQPTEEEPSKLADGLPPRAKPLVCQTAIPRCKPQPLALSLNSTLGTADGLVCNSSFVWNQPIDFTLRTVGGSWNAQPLWLKPALFPWPSS